MIVAISIVTKMLSYIAQSAVNFAFIPKELLGAYQ